MPKANSASGSSRRARRRQAVKRHRAPPRDRRRGASRDALLAGRLVTAPGALLAIDYGYSQPGAGETLAGADAPQTRRSFARAGRGRSYRPCRFRRAGAGGAGGRRRRPRPHSQGKFLARLGIFERAAALKRKATGRKARRSMRRSPGSLCPAPRAARTRAWRSCLRFSQSRRPISPPRPASIGSQDKINDGRS